MLIQRMLLCVLFLVMLSAQANAQHGASRAPDVTEHTLSIAGQERWYRVVRPALYHRGSAAVLLLHGHEQSMYHAFDGGGVGMREWPILAQEKGFLLVIPNAMNPKGDPKGTKQYWDEMRYSVSEGKKTAHDVLFLKRLVEHIVGRYGVDFQRVYVIGSSSGGVMAQQLLLEIPELFAAGAAFNASLPQDMTMLHRPWMKTPLMLLNGTKDRHVLWEGGYAFGYANPLMSVDDYLSWWQRTNYSDVEASREFWLPDRDPDDACRVRQTYFPALEGGATLMFYQMDGGGHAIPSMTHRKRWYIGDHQSVGTICRDVEGARIAWDFMRKFVRE